jgi:hypothetical protein
VGSPSNHLYHDESGRTGIKADMIAAEKRVEA